VGRSSGTFERSYFEANYRDYQRQNPPAKMRHYREAVQRHLTETLTPRVLDLGCAFGTFLASLAPAWERYGADVSEYAIAQAEGRVPGATLAVMRDGRIPFCKSFHAVTAWDVLEHIADLEAVAEEVKGHLAEQGVFLFLVPVYDGPLGPLVGALDGDPTHLHRVSRGFWLDWAARHFVVHEWWGVFRYLFAGRLYLHWPTRALRRIAPAIAIAARRRSAAARPGHTLAAGSAAPGSHD
jgi:SAM-dependent methyltransferase